MVFLNPKEYLSKDNVLIIPQSNILWKPVKQESNEPESDPGSTDNTSSSSDKSTIQIPEGFIAKDFRLLSESLLWNIFGLCDYSLPGVIEKSMPLFPQTLSVFKDHWWSVDSIVGYSTGFSYGKLNNLAGIDAKLMIDTQVDPKTARNVQTGAANRCSLTLATRLEKSHPNMRTDVFYDTMGEEVDGIIVRWLVKEILEFFELSLVWYGADSTATAHIKQKIEHYKAVSKNKFYLGGVFSQEKEVNMDPELQAILSLIKETANIECATLSQAKDAFKNIFTQNTTLKNQVSALEAQVNEFKPGHEKYKTITEGVRTDIIRMMKVLSGKTKDEELDALELQVIQNAGYDRLLTIQQQKKELLEKAVPVKCAVCGSSNVSRRSSVETPVEPVEPNQPGFKQIGLK